MHNRNFDRTDIDNRTAPKGSQATRRWILALGTQLVTLGLLVAAVPTESTSAITIRFPRNRNHYRVCTKELIGSGVTPDAAAGACAGALHPRDISKCVVQINRKTKIAAADALSSCQRVRRPNELATCVVDINGKSRTQPAAPLLVLDQCRRSLLPQQFSECVVGLSRQLDFPTDRLMSTCLDSRDKVTLDGRPAPTPPAELITPPSRLN
ncbi:MAG: hypothetical protein HC789_07540 [Microcoleus sp. CSU_2_2]|nr:hypothetical protein [Microcoleus sp. SU_5_3]NJS10237.1 hypothetical protein [Microcoleus sp. CSU_2_2]